MVRMYNKFLKKTRGNDQSKFQKKQSIIKVTINSVVNATIGVCFIKRLWRQLMRYLMVFFLMFSIVLAQEEIAGYGDLNAPSSKMLSSSAKPVVLSGQETFLYRLTGYSFADVVVFSYFDRSVFVAYDQTGTAVDSVELNRDEYYTFKLTAGAFTIECNNSFTALTGDPITRSVMGFFAVDESGSPLSTHVNTYMPRYAKGGEKLIVFAYDDGTEVQIKNLSDSTTAAAVVLNRGEHVALSNVLDSFVGIRASKPVSVLSYADQGYYIPSDNGSFAGTQFFGFSGYLGGWPNGVVVTAYEDSTAYFIYDSQTGNLIEADTLNYGETGTYVTYRELYWEVQTNKPVTVCNTPYAAYSGSYYYMVRQIDKSGRGIGTHFLAPSIAGDFVVFSYEDNNNIRIVNLNTLDTTYVTLQSMENYQLYSSKAVYEVLSDANIAIFSSWGGSYGADFAPLNFSLKLPDLAIAANDIDFDPDSISRVPGTPFTIYATVHNYGYTTAYDVNVRFFDGPPTANNAISPVFVIDSLPAGAQKTLSIDWETPTNVEYHSVYVVVDQQNLITESNESNNTAWRNLIPNDDLLPPLSTVVTAPQSVTYNGDSLSFDEFDIEVEVYNNGDVVAPNTAAILHLPWQFSISDTADTVHVFGDVAPKTTVKFVWHVYIDAFPETDEDAYFYSITVKADNVEEKNVKRALLFEDSTTVNINAKMGAMPDGFVLRQNYPNPFNPLTQVEYYLPKTGQVEVAVYDLNGRLIQRLQNGVQNAGKHQLNFDGSQLSSGFYFLRLKFNGQDIGSIKMTLIK